jgi:hypothetical protein
MRLTALALAAVILAAPVAVHAAPVIPSVMDTTSIPAIREVDYRCGPHAYWVHRHFSRTRGVVVPGHCKPYRPYR